ncbi:MAG: cytochrome c3 family protein [Saprospiraceae bacterium]
MWRVLLMISACLWLHLTSVGQLSPGKLSKYHSHLEGLSNCTKCHDLGNQISEQKCLNCHELIQTRVQQNKGYHASNAVKGKKCTECHSEHHGVGFEMVRFDKKMFDHNLTGYLLQGAHKSVNCSDCHKPANIENIAIKLNSNTYLGLTPTCISCHEDAHKNTLGKDCKKCHNEEKFVPASRFDHNKTEFPLTGGHKGIECISCHKISQEQAKKFQNFAGLKANNCNDCHKDAHDGAFGKDCKSCHSTESFHTLKSSTSFNHNLTGFPLEGRHAGLQCRSCHDDNNMTKQYQEFKNKTPIVCKTCHEDPHVSKFGNECKKCHTQTSFSVVRTLSEFDHTLTGFVLEGKHTMVDCRKCHTSKYMTAPLAYDQCKSCHTDYHNEQFNNLANSDCNTCHTVQGFSPSTFDLDRHNLASFTLNGAHIATPCFACHKPDDKNWSFRNIGNTCVDCHDNIHIGYISESYLKNEACQNCHKPERWADINFDHNQTAFALKGKHQSIQCRSCHFNEDKGDLVQKFKGLEQNCFSCHDNVHGTQFDESGVTDCKRCHGFDNWDRSNFNHDNTRFKLIGAHTNLDCSKCHFQQLDGDTARVLYKTNKLDCKDCHL